MERPIKKVGNLVPKMFKAFSLYIIMTLLVFFGYIQIFGKIESGPITLPVLGASAEEENYFAEFVQSFSKFKNIDVDFDLNVKNGNIDFSAKNSKVAFDMEKQEFAFETLLAYNGQSFAVSAGYVNSCLHLSLNGKNYKFDTTKATDIDMSGVLDFVLNSVNINTDAILSKVSAIIGVDLTKIDSTTILSSLETKEEILDDGTYKFNIKFGKLEALVYCDENFNITSAKAHHSTLGGISLFANVIVMNGENFAVEYDNPENEIELDGIMEYITYAKELNNKDIVSADLNFEIEGETYAGMLTVDRTDGLKVKFDFNQGVNACVVYADETVYVQLENIKVKFNVEDYNKFKDALDKTIQNATSLTTKEFIVSIIEKFLKNNGSDNGEFDFNDIISDVSEKLDLNKILSYLPDQAVMTENEYSILWNAGLEIVLTQDAGVLNGVSVNSENVNLSANIYDGKEIVFDDAGYCDAVNLLPVLKFLMYIENGIYEFDFVVDYNGLDLNGTFKYFNGKMEISVLNLFGETLKVNLQDSYIFVNYANMKFKVAVPQNQGNSNFDLIKILNSLTSDKLGVDIDFGGFQAVIDVLQNYTVQDFFKNLKLSANSTCVALELYYNNKVVAKLTFSNEENKLTEAQIDCSVLSGKVVVNYVEKSTIDVINSGDYETYTTDIVEGILDSFKITDGIYSFSTDLAVRYSTNQFFGSLVGILIKDDDHKGLIDGYVPAVAFYTSSLGLDSYIFLVDNTVYISIAGLQVYADLNEQTISEIMEIFNQFTSSDATSFVETAEAFKMVLPSLTEIYGQWIFELTEENETNFGVQINIKDNFYYASQASFYDIVAKVIVQKDGSKLLPSAITLGANIDDKNTTLNENGYKDYLLTVNGELIEDYDLTGNKNFAVYIYNLTAGNASQISDNFVIENGELTGFVANDVVLNISDFHHYSELLPLLSAYDYLASFNYQLGLSGSVASESQIIKINEGSDLTLKINQLTDVPVFDKDEELGEQVLSWFDNNYIKVLGDVDINIQSLIDATDVQHKMSVFYESNDSGELYLSYSHGDLVGNKEFNGKVKNSNLSTLVSMILSLMGMELDEQTMISWGLEPCKTDFTYLQKLLNIDVNQNNDNSNIDDMLQSITNITNVLSAVELETSEEDVFGNFTTTLKINLKETFGANASIGLVISNNKIADNTTSKLNKLAISGVCVGANEINLEIKFDQFTDEKFDYDTSKAHIDLSSITELMDVAVSTLNTQNIAFNGSTSIGIMGIDAINVYYDLLVELSDSGDVGLYLEMVVPSFVDVTYNAGGFGNTYTVYSAYGFDKRVSTLEYKDGVLNLVQNTYGNKYTGWAAWKKRDEKITKSWRADEIGSHIMEIFAYMLGLTDTVYNKIGDLIASMNPNPTLEQTIMSYAPIFTTVNQKEVFTGFSMGLEGKSLTGDANFDNMNVQIDLSDAYVVNGKEYRFIETVSTKIGIKNDTVSIPLKLNSVTGESYVTTGGKTIYSNDYYRKQYLNKIV